MWNVECGMWNVEGTVDLDCVDFVDYVDCVDSCHPLRGVDK